MRFYCTSKSCKLLLIVVRVLHRRIAEAVREREVVIEVLHLRVAQAVREVARPVLAKVVLAVQHAVLFVDCAVAAVGAELRAARHFEHARHRLERAAADCQLVLLVRDLVVDIAVIEAEAVAVALVVRTDRDGIRAHVLVERRLAVAIQHIDAQAGLPVIGAAAEVDLLREDAVAAVQDLDAVQGLAAGALRDVVDRAAERTVRRDAGEDGTRPLEHVDAVHALDAAVEARRDAVEAVELDILLLCFEAADVPGARHARQRLVADRRGVDDDVINRRDLIVLHHLVRVSRDVERHIERRAVAEHTELNRRRDLAARIGSRSLFFVFRHRFHRSLHRSRLCLRLCGRLCGFLCIDVARAEVVDLVLCRRHGRMHGQR